MTASIRRQRLYLQTLFLLAALASLLWVAWNLGAERNPGHHLTTDLLSLKQAETQLDRQVQRLVSLDAPHFDDVANALRETRARRREMNRKAFIRAGRAHELWQQYLDKSREKASLVRRLQSRVAVIRNSLAYIPGAAETAKDPRLPDLVMDLLALNVTPDHDALHDLRRRIGQLRGFSAQGDHVLDHIQAGLEARAEMEPLRSRYQGLSVAGTLDELIDTHSRYLAQQNRRAELIGTGLSLLLAAVMIALGYTLFRLQRAHSSLEITSRRLHDAIESLPEAFALFDGRQRLVFWNDRLADFYPQLHGQLRPGEPFNQLADTLGSGTFCLTDSNGPAQPINGTTHLQETPDGQSFLASDSRTSEGGIVSLRTDITRQRLVEAELHKLSLAVEHSPAGVGMTDAQGHLEYVNPRFEAITGFDAEALIGRIPAVLRDPGSAVWKSIREGRGWQGETLARRKDGSEFWQDVTISSITREGGKLSHLIVLIEDVSERKRHEETMRLASTVFEASSEAIMVTDRHNRIKAVNPAFTAITGYERDEVVGKNPRILSSGRHFSGFYESMWHSLNSRGRWQGEIWNRRKNGQAYAEWLSIVMIRDAQGEVEEYVAIFSDITRQKRDEEKIRWQANFDQLTGLVNRTLFQDRLDSTLARAQREDTCAAMLFIDLDGFKFVNDTLGHDYGDELLREVAGRLRQRTRKSDTLARLGGDEFTLLLSPIQDRHQPARVAEQFVESLSRPFNIDRRDIRVGASIGIAMYPQDAEDSTEMIRKADLAMYRAKEAGKNTFAFFTRAMDEQVNRRMALENDLRQALEVAATPGNPREDASHGLDLHYQPIVAPGESCLTGFEVLARWKHASRGAISPADFIPIAEQSSLINDFGDWALTMACRQLADWNDAGLDHLGLAVNLSTRQIQRGLSVEAILERAREAGARPEQLTLEVTESLLIEDAEHARQWLVTAREAGFRIALDDFGTGYSSLAYLRTLPVDYLKLDRSFIRDVPGKGHDSALIRGLVLTAHSLGLEVIAEGVETEEQLEFLQAQGCDRIQGFLFSPPVPAKQALEMARGEYDCEEFKQA